MFPVEWLVLVTIVIDYLTSNQLLTLRSFVEMFLEIVRCLLAFKVVLRGLKRSIIG